ncbi:MAG: hypothetical protein KGD60_14905 [Candidatus Thorarchaeota archaeon]|nr:hypothetical protein [Candidatus Thorarchaeota archaeon]
MKVSSITGGAGCCGIFLIVLLVGASAEFGLLGGVMLFGSIILIACVFPIMLSIESSREKERLGKELLEKESSTGVIQERIITERVLVVCPFCSTKVEQGTSFCTNCGGKM